MRLILSRKGLDSSFGGVPSPVLPDGRLCWLPIPESAASARILPAYDDLVYGESSLGAIVADVARGRLARSQTVHLDPDLSAQHRTRVPGWRPAFGQTGAAERHLQHCGVSAGDLFLFFAWFRQTEYLAGRLRFVPKSPDLHVIFGWLQVERRLARDLFFDCPDWLRGHPHAQAERYNELDSIYVAAECLTGLEGGRYFPGAGQFRRIRPSLVLSAPGGTRSTWMLPADFFPGPRAPLSYHGDPRRWNLRNSHVLLKSVGRGQEFVLDMCRYPGVSRWLSEEIFDRDLNVADAVL